MQTPLVLKILATASLSIPHSISLLLLDFSAWFLKIFALSRPSLSSCALLSSFYVLFQVNFILFSILVTVRILIILGMFLRIKIAYL
jgi:hypothetical protein